ncbi:DUF3106 domain-containing protein [soil metagenome]
MVKHSPDFTARQQRAVCILAFPFLLTLSGFALSAGESPAANPPIIKPTVPATVSVGKTAVKVASKPLWIELTPAQQQALSPLSAEWDKLEPLRKKKWLEIAQKYSAMTPEEQIKLQTRMREWAKLTPEQRRVARESYARAKKLNPDQKAVQWSQYQQLPEEQKKKLANDAVSSKQVANLPSAKSKGKTVAPIKAVNPPTQPLQVQPTATHQAPEPGPATAAPASEPTPQPTNK